MRSVVVTAAFVLPWALGACGADEWSPPTLQEGEAYSSRASAQAPASAEKPQRIRSARCPAGAANCASAVGRVMFIESVDPDGDGDLHVVATRTKGEAVTGAGLVVFDVNKDLRPRRDPKAGDLVTGAGPVYPGSYGQQQIQVTEFRVKRR
jgi:hypothetical protein